MVNLDNLFKLIQDKGLTVKKLSDLTGISHGNIGDWKRGKTKPSSTALVTLADYFNCSVDYLLGRVDNPTYSEASKNENENLVENDDNNLTAQEAELVKIYRSLDLEGQRKVLAALFEANNRF